MRGMLLDLFRGEEASFMRKIFGQMLRTPAMPPGMNEWFQMATGEPLAKLYEIYDDCRRHPQMVGKILELQMGNYNIYGGVDTSQELDEQELFWADLQELGEAVDLWIMSGQITEQAYAYCQQSSGFYRANGGPNLGALNVLRGWYELLQVVNGEKHLRRCVAPDCEKLLLVHPENYPLSGTVSGFHSAACERAHTEGAEDQEVPLEQLPGIGQLQETMGQFGRVEHESE